MKREAITPCGERSASPAAVSGSGRSVGRRGAVAPGSAWALVTGAGSGIGRCYALRLAALLPPAPLKNRLPQPETPDRLLPESETVILAVPTVGPDGMLRTPTVPERYPLAECLRLLPERAVVLGGTLPPDCRKIEEERHLAYTDLLALPELQELNAIATAE